MESDNPPIKEVLIDNKNVIYIPRENEKEYIIVKSLDETLRFIDRDWEVVEDLNNDMFLMNKSIKLTARARLREKRR